MGRKTITLIAAGVTAAIGASLVFLYVQGVDSRAQADAEPVEVLTANAAIEAGETVSDAQAAGKLELTETPGSAVLPGALTTTDTISDMVALAPIYAGEQVLAAKFGLVGSQSRISIPSNTMAISLELTDPQRVAGFVSPGSSVAVFASLGTACAAGTTALEPTEPQIRLLLAEVPVIGVGQTGIRRHHHHRRERRADRPSRSRRRSSRWLSTRQMPSGPCWLRRRAASRWVSSPTSPPSSRLRARPSAASSARSETTVTTIVESDPRDRRAARQVHRIQLRSWARSSRSRRT